MAQSFKSFLETLEDSPDPQAEYFIRTRIVEFINSSSYDENSIEAKSENIAFSLIDVPEGSKWGTNYGPLATFLDEDGNEIDGPSLEMIDSEVIEYWKKRSHEARNPIFVFRYSDLVWEFSETATSRKPDVKFAQRAIDASIGLAASRAHKHDIETIRRLERALSLSLSINDKKRLTSVRDALIEFQNLVSDDRLPGTWTSGFDSLLLNKKISLTKKQETELVNTLEGRLRKFRQESELDESCLSPAEVATDRLLKYYSSIEDAEKLKSVLDTYTHIVLNSSQHLSGIVSLHWIKQLYDLLVSYGMEVEAEELSTHLEAAGGKAGAELKPISVSVTIPKDKLQDYYNEFCSGSLTNALLKIAGHFIPRKQRIQKQLEDLSSKSPLSFLLSRSILDRDGRIIAQIASLDEDPIGHYIGMLNQNIQFESPFLREAINRVIIHFDVNVEVLLNYLELSPLFEPRKHKQLSAGLSAYLENDHFAAIAILVPIIEAAIRQLLRFNKSSIYKRGRHGGVDLKLLGDCLYDQSVVSTFGEDIRDYLTAILIDPRGWNIRNNFCHGIFDDEYFASVISDRILHLLLILAVVRLSEDGA